MVQGKKQIGTMSDQAENGRIFFKQAQNSNCFFFFSALSHMPLCPFNLNMETSGLWTASTGEWHIVLPEAPLCQARQFCASGVSPSPCYLLSCCPGKSVCCSSGEGLHLFHMHQVKLSSEPARSAFQGLILGSQKCIILNQFLLFVVKEMWISGQDLVTSFYQTTG